MQFVQWFPFIVIFVKIKRYHHDLMLVVFNYILFWIILFLKSSSIGKATFFPQIQVKYTWYLREKKNQRSVKCQ